MNKEKIQKFTLELIRKDSNKTTKQIVKEIWNTAVEEERKSQKNKIK